jgi:hypothetical protein
VGAVGVKEFSNRTHFVWLIYYLSNVVWYATTIAIIPSKGGRTVGIVTSAVIIYYLYRLHVKRILVKQEWNHDSTKNLKLRLKSINKSAGSLPNSDTDDNQQIVERIFHGLYVVTTERD